MAQGLQELLLSVSVLSSVQDLEGGTQQDSLYFTPLTTQFPLSPPMHDWVAAFHGHSFAFPIHSVQTSYLWALSLKNSKLQPRHSYPSCLLPLLIKKKSHIYISNQ
jgi:hypothetical protein